MVMEEIPALKAGIKARDKAVVEAIAQRKAEKDEDLMKTNNTVKEEGILWARRRINKFHNLKLYKLPRTDYSKL